jgi:hypothetical protein
VAAGRRGDAVELYQTTAVGIPQDVAEQLRHAPFRPALEAIAHTLAYDAAIIGDLSLPAGLLATVATPALVITGENSPPFLRNAALRVAGGVCYGLGDAPSEDTEMMGPQVRPALSPVREQE